MTRVQMKAMLLDRVRAAASREERNTIDLWMVQSRWAFLEALLELYQKDPEWQAELGLVFPEEE